MPHKAQAARISVTPTWGLTLQAASGPASLQQHVTEGGTSPSGWALPGSNPTFRPRKPHAKRTNTFFPTWRATREAAEGRRCDLGPPQPQPHRKSENETAHPWPPASASCRRPVTYLVSSGCECETAPTAILHVLTRLWGSTVPKESERPACSLINHQRKKPIWRDGGVLGTHRKKHGARSKQTKGPDKGGSGGGEEEQLAISHRTCFQKTRSLTLLHPAHSFPSGWGSP